MKFEYDLKKSQSNKAKHDMDFEEAKELWADPDRLEAPVMRPGEERFIVIGAMRGTYWAAIITYRENAVRLISVRRARSEERKHYETDKNNS